MMQVDHASEEVNKEPPIKKQKISEDKTISSDKSPRLLTQKTETATENLGLKSHDDEAVKYDEKVKESHGDKTSNKVERTDDKSGGKTATEDQTVVGESPCAQVVGPASEEDVGVTEFISSHDGFSAIIKQRYSDFIVNEISKDGLTVHLTSTELPAAEPQSESADKDPDSEEGISEMHIAEIQKLVEGRDPKASYFIKVDSDKEARKRIHLAIKKRFPQVNSNTEKQEGEESCIKISLKSKGGDQRSESTWPPNRGAYCHFVLYKEGIGTMDAVNLMAKFLRTKTNVFQYAGTKDKRAKTSQDVSAFKVDAKKLHSLNNRLNKIMLGNFRYEKENIALAQLSGNHFTIVLRNVTGDDSQIEAAMTSLKNNGFINYFGMQRFGTTSIPTHHVGRALLHGNWEEAVELILQPSKAVSEGSAKSFESSHIEKTLLRALQKHGERNFSAALSQIARNTRLMYVHAYQSYVWNSMVSKRLQLLGTKPIVGDLVVLKNDAGKLKNSDFLATTNDQDVVKVKPLVLDADNIGDFSLADVVLPLPGHQVVYPENKVADWYKEIMELDNLDINNMKKSHKDYSLPGTYRHMIITPSNFTWKMYRYDDYLVPLVLSDKDVMEKQPEPVSVQDGKFRALVMELTLPPASYATMALREVLKTSTSASFQTSINVT
ncbi:pseudouridylate synthase 7 homolog isoform X2 [Gigantopelta aegis]|uniref:pseudouridylate synthase 7 homolog isoform X2 n=1 Tax=Gigantopelta aegis TaxID=1735272 RepID=UPI001B8893DB|nr:pseudouridylate synthase 7 homolog isoform X2 [Gigantopelta aegis]